ncbi:ABC transporter ATP-binding protein [Tindallia californiensis]|uniref:ATP-binding cassette, subfamily C n=1 Tax=Tindallia californiensis TaxID=159292 RepID=A0A1H3PB97_9FIRM|nr:ABC transporter ATP-binding protein [Tindallia californiensis]SDY98422.1 ATP-binding cassette, subfamily C [Tindallia californiensis]
MRECRSLKPISTEKRNFIQKLYDILTPKERLHAVFLFFLSLVTAFAQAFGVFSVFPFINVVMDPAVIHSNEWLLWAYEKGNFADENAFMMFLGIVVFIAIFFSSIISALTIWAKMRYVMRRNHDISRRLLTTYLSRSYAFFLQKNTSELAQTILAEVKQLTDQYLIGLFEIVINTMIFISIIVMLLWVDTLVTLGAVVFLGGTYVLLNMFIRDGLKKKGAGRVESNQGRYKIASEALDSIKTTKVMGVENYFIREYSKYSKKYAQYNTYYKVAGKIPHYLIESIAFGGIVFFIVFQLGRGNDVITLIPLISLFALAGKRILPALQKLYGGVVQVHFNQAILDKLHLDLVVAEEQTDELEGENKEAISFTRKIRFQDVLFTYEGASEKVLKGINLEIEKNAMIGFVGTTGSGKTTLIDLLMGLMTPDSGQITIDGTPLSKSTVKSWQKRIGYVPQDIYLSDDTICNNIAFGVKKDDIDEERVRRAAQLAAIHTFIESELPEQYSTEIGERGVRLSGGQRQRIGLARALYRNPDVLVLDEATSALDGATEEAVLKDIGKEAGSRTVIMIAHRLTTLINCDQIFVLEGGELIGQGTYEELMQSNERFRQMARMEK